MLDALAPEVTGTYVRMSMPARSALQSDRARPGAAISRDRAAIRQAGADFWPLRAFRELDDALLRLRFHYDEIGVVLLKTRGDLEAVRAHGCALYHFRDDWLVERNPAADGAHAAPPGSDRAQPVRRGGSRLLLRRQPARNRAGRGPHLYAARCRRRGAHGVVTR